MSAGLVSIEEISKHDSPSDCWLVIDNQVWDMTEFAPSHPGGPGIIHRYAGRDATQAYSEVHAPSVIKDNLAATKLKGRLDPSTINDEWLKPPPTAPQANTPAGDNSQPDLDTIINAHDFELAAQKTATAKTWAFYSSGANDLITRDANASLYSRIWFRPRVMRNVRTVSTSSTILGLPTTLPILISPAAMAKLIHPDGELAIARAAHSKGIIQCISTGASYPAAEIVTSIPSSPTSGSQHPFFFQLYVDKQRSKSAALLQKLHQHGNIRAIFVTADAAAAGKREADERLRADESLASPITGVAARNDNKGGGYGRVMGGFIDPSLHWGDIAWLRAQTRLPLVLKGVMSASDVKLACHHGLDGVMLSNHGGRNLDTSPPAILTLLECHRRCPEVFASLDIYIDGGIRRGSDVLKCVALGATAVGLGRPVLFATAYGQQGVEHLIDILQDELEVAMRNCGVTSLEEVGPWLVNTADLDHLVPAEEAHPYARDWRRGKRERGIKAKL
ncbi:hypothetical protein GJ744_012171 [Endocarpon pusillum]|uniref:L-lactate dehydrogenase (cytochrome) n=1 Tax=Endocarpon pusillum TaxID=364733 RepID=A0A8H7AFI7_9EURO|nr:hypothetical protein GJ744_012171 [Endocarpon pusillum]